MPETDHWHQGPLSLNLQRLRIHRGMSRREFALLAGVAPNTVRGVEHGSLPREPTQVKLAAAISVLLGREITPTELWPLIEDGEAA